MDPDEGLPWPDAAKVEAWWCIQSHRFQTGVALSWAGCWRIGSRRLAGGVSASADRGRVALVALESGNPLFEWRAPARRQQCLLASMAARYSGAKIGSCRPGRGDDDTAWPKNDFRSLIAARALATIGTLPSADCLHTHVPAAARGLAQRAADHSADLGPLRSARRLDRSGRQQHARAARSRASHLAPPG